MPLRWCQKHNPNGLPEAALETDIPSGMHMCQFQYPCVLIFTYALALAIYIYGGLSLKLWYRETHMNPQRNRWIIVDPAWIELTTSRLWQHHRLPAAQYVCFMPLKLFKKHNPNDMADAAMDNWQPVWNTHTHTRAHTCLYTYYFFLNWNDISPGSSHPSIQHGARPLTGDLPITGPLTTDLWILKTLSYFIILPMAILPVEC